MKANEASNPASGTTDPSDPPAQEGDVKGGTGEYTILHAVTWSNFLLELPTIPGTDAIDYTAWLERSRKF